MYPHQACSCHRWAQGPLLLADQPREEVGFKGITAHHRLIEAPTLPFSFAGNHQQPGVAKVFIINSTFLFVAKLWTFSLAKCFSVSKRNPSGYEWYKDSSPKMQGRKSLHLSKESLWVKFLSVLLPACSFLLISFSVSPLPHFLWPFGSL